MERICNGILKEWTLSPGVDPRITFSWFEGAMLAMVRENEKQIAVISLPADSTLDQVECKCWEWLWFNLR